jgi:nicotinic acid mononucleotide adenylyltransferase
MSRVTVMIGAMKPMTAGHYRLITEAVADSQCPEGETPANETYVLISMQDRIKKNQFPVRGETALSALRDIYMDPASGLFEFGADKYVKMVFCHSEKFGRENPERVAEMREIISGIREALGSRGLANVSVDIEEVRSGPPDVLMGLAESRPEDHFVLYTGDDDLKKYQYFKRYANNVDFAGFERFEGGMSGTEVRSLFQTDSDTEGFDTDRFGSAFPQGVDASRVRQRYRTDAGLNPLKEIKRADKGTPDYSRYLQEMIDELQYIKSEYNYRKKEGRQYRKEASLIQNTISELKRQKRKNDRLNEIEKENTLNEDKGIDNRSILKEWFSSNYKRI